MSTNKETVVNVHTVKLLCNGSSDSRQNCWINTNQHTVAASPRIQMLFNVTKNHPALYDQSSDFTSKVVV
jgi:hypothetical protein